MKYLFLYLWPLLLCCACQSSSLRLKGKAYPGLKSKEMTVHLPGSSRDSVLARSGIAADGSFELVLPSGRPQVLEVKAANDYFTWPVVAGEGVYVLQGEASHRYFSGGPDSLQERFAASLQAMRQKEKEYYQLCQGYDTITDIRRKAEFSERLNRKFGENEAFRLQQIRNFAGTEAAQYFIFQVLYYYENDYKAFSRAMEALGDSIPGSRMKTMILAAYNKLKSAQLTGPAPEFTLKDPQGKAVSLRDFRGKYVLVDFWASWCAPCRAKNKELFKQYPQWKKEGLEVISISLDDNKDKWLEAVRTDQVNWIQLSDLKGFNESEVAQAYKIRQVPTVYLINPQGEVIQTNPSADELEAILKQ